MLYLSDLASDTAVPLFYRTRYHRSYLVTIQCQFIPLLTSLLANIHFHIIFPCQFLYSKQTGFPTTTLLICCLISVATSISFRHFLNSIPPRDIVSKPVAAQSKAWVCGLACWNCRFESRRGHGCLSLACCQVEIAATGHCRVQRSPTACGVFECGRGTSQRKARPTTAVEHWLKKRDILIHLAPRQV
jgi:hypothetical protein